MRSKIIVLAIATAFWYFSSSINAVATQRLFQGLRSAVDDLNTTANGETVDQKGVILVAVVLTVGQLTMGAILSLAFLFCFGGPPRQQQQSGSSTTSRNQIQELFQQIQKQDILIGLFHCIGSICTNIAFGYGSASLVQVIKLLEPIETLLFSALVQKTLEGLSFKKVTSTMAIIVGTFMLLSNPSIDVNSKSVMFAIGSGICMASRSVLSKKRQKPGSAASPEGLSEARTFKEILGKGIEKFANITILAAICALVVSLFMALHSFSLLKDVIPQLLHDVSPKVLNQTIIFHCLYNMASITVLSLTSATSHSLLNVGKRIANVMIASMAFNIPLTFNGKVGLVTAAIGACVYNDEISAAWQNRASLSLRKKRYLVTMVTFGFLFYLPYNLMEFTSHQQTDTVFRTTEVVASRQQMDTVVPEAEVVVGSNSTRKNKVVLLGPHDRYNFGDLIFSKVVAKLLTSRAGYSPHEILYGGIVSVDMSAYGGPPNVISMKQIQNLSRSDAVHPYDIIFTGGEALGCTFKCALDMLPTPELRAQAKREKIHGCGYAFPKHLLRPPQPWFSNSTNNNYAVVNSLGGLVNNACREAVRTADYKAYRDHNPLFPDSAVMTKELFSDEINKAATEVMQDLGFGTDRKFVAVQHRKNQMKAKELASILDAVARGLNATVVFFAAGTAPHHDSFESYQVVVSLMEEDAIVYKAENMWKVIGLISRAEAILSTSLHVRIMAFIHFKPRVTWCRVDHKHSHFISMWDTKASAPCVEDETNTLDILNHHYLTNPDIARELTTATYERLVKKYLESFSKYSGLLRPQTEHR